MEFGANWSWVNVFWLCQLLIVNTWESQSLSRCFSFCLWRVRIITILHRTVGKIKWENFSKTLNTEPVNRTCSIDGNYYYEFVLSNYLQIFYIDLSILYHYFGNFCNSLRLEGNQQRGKFMEKLGSNLKEVATCF